MVLTNEQKIDRTGFATATARKLTQRKLKSAFHALHNQENMGICIAYNVTLPSKTESKQRKRQIVLRQIRNYRATS